MKVKATQQCLTLCDPVTIQSTEFSRPEYWSGQPFPSPGCLPDPGIKPGSPALQADSLPAELLGMLGLNQWISKFYIFQQWNAFLKILHRTSSQETDKSGATLTEGGQRAQSLNPGPGLGSSRGDVHCEPFQFQHVMILVPQPLTPAEDAGEE